MKLFLLLLVSISFNVNACVDIYLQEYRNSDQKIRKFNPHSYPYKIPLNDSIWDCYVNGHQKIYTFNCILKKDSEISIMSGPIYSMQTGEIKLMNQALNSFTKMTHMLKLSNTCN
jgi:hypothetical protein